MLEFFVYLVTVAITPGPNTISSMANGAEKGLRGLTFNLGMLMGIAFISSLSYLLISFFSKYIPLLSSFLQILGIIYLVYLGVKMMEKTGTFIDGMTMQLMNVKVLMLCVTAISGYILPLDVGNWQKWIRVSMIPLTCFICGVIWALAGTALKGIYEKGRKVFNLLFAFTLFVLAFINIIKLFC